MHSVVSDPARVLFLGGDIADYLSVSVLNGLKSISTCEVVDYPKADIIYRESRELLEEQIRGKAHFTAFFLHDDRPVNRFHVSLGDLDNFDLVVVGDIQNNFGLFVQLLPKLNPRKTAILDGSDTQAPYPYHGYFWRRPYYWCLPRAHRRFLYFKRELTLETVRHLWLKLVPRRLAKFLPVPRMIKPISFAIPDEKIVSALPVKTKDFPRHIVDPDVQKCVEGAFSSYAFDTEELYYADLQSSRFGITTKRSGWDCMRHYEIAANGAVICFRDLKKKPSTCAPHGLIDGHNCIAYENAVQLMNRIESLTPDQYSNLQNRGLSWVRENSCCRRAQQLLDFFLPKEIREAS